MNCVCASFEKLVQMNLEKLSNGRKIKQHLIDCFVASVELNSYELDFACDDHQHYVRSALIDLLARVRIHHFV